MAVRSIAYNRRHRKELAALKAHYAQPQAGSQRFISEPLRIGLRFFGFAMLVAGLAIAGAFVALGPHDMADKMGESCAHGQQLVREAEACTVRDVLSLVLAAPPLILIGAVLAFALRRER